MERHIEASEESDLQSVKSGTLVSEDKKGYIGFPIPTSGNAMMIPFLCMVSAGLLIWVILLKMEINQLKGGKGASTARKTTKRGVSGKGTAGNKSFDLG